MINKKASVLVYVIILVGIVMSLAVIVSNNYSSLVLNFEDMKIKHTLSQNINSKTNIIYSKLKETNTDWSWFVDNIACPKDFTMSWTTIKDENISSTLIYSWALNPNIFCSGSFDNKNFKILFNSWFTDLEKIKYDGWELNINSWSLSWNISNTFFNLENTTNYYYSDWIDDNFDDDNYLFSNSWSVNYPNDYEDNDDYIRKNIVWYIFPNQNNNIFWNNSKIEEFIENNPNNSWSIKLWLVQSGALFFETNTWSTMTIFVVDKNIYTNFNKIKISKEFYGSFNNSGSWYIQINSDIISFDSDIWNSYSFDFVNNDYMIFVKDTDNKKVLYYTLYFIDKNHNKRVYINPINDNINNKLSFSVLWYDVILNNKWNAIWKLQKRIFKKP